MQNENITNYRHTLAHLLASAVLELYPNTKNTIGPAIDNGFYYDFEFQADIKISDDDLIAIEKKMKTNLKSWDKFTHRIVSEKEAKEIFKNNSYKIKIIDEIVNKGEDITLYSCGDFTDLCRGGHLDNPSKEIIDGSYKLSRIAGAYWKGNENNTMLTRIYGLAFSTKLELDDYEVMKIEAEKRDHRKIGKEMKIFTFDEDTGTGLPLWLPYGTAIIDELEGLAKQEEYKMNYHRVRTPHIAKESMYKKSGHLPYYEDSMFPPMEYEGGKYYLRAMNCPHHHKVFSAEKRSYRELPLRLAEYGTVYRHEKSGELFGLMRVRMLQMNDAHIYCTEDQFADEFRAVNQLYLNYFKIFGISKYIMRFSTHDPAKLGKKYVDDSVLWKKTEDMVRKVLIESKIPYIEVPDEAAFYGPKIDVQVWSAIGREFTLATNQVDFAVPKRFDLTYTDSDGIEKTPLCIHRAPLGTHERFIGFLIEHYGGNFPLWLAPVQVKIIPIGESHHAKAIEIYDILRTKMIRVELDITKDGFGKKIRQAKLNRIPYFIIIGDKDIAISKVTLESRDNGQIGQLSESEVVEKMVKEIKERK